MRSRLLAFVILSLATTGCGGASSPSAPSSATSGDLNVTGTWVEVRGTLNMTLTQTGNSVTGTSTFNDRNDVFGSYAGDGTVTGTISGNTLTMKEVYTVSGATSGRDTSNCKETVDSTWTITSPTSMNGPFMQVDTCDGMQVFSKGGNTTVQKQ